MKNSKGSNINDKKDNDGSRQLSALIIDDDSWMQRLLSHYLSGWGFKCYTASDAYDGLAMAIKRRPILIILDIVMPEINGDKLLKFFKKIDITSDIPILIISSHLSIDMFGTTYKEGAIAFLSKPFSQELLCEKVSQSLGSAISFVKNGDVERFEIVFLDEEKNL